MSARYTVNSTTAPWNALRPATTTTARRAPSVGAPPARGCPRRSGKLVATPARLWYQSGVFNKEERPPMKKPYKIVSGASTPNSRELADCWRRTGNC